MSSVTSLSRDSPGQNLLTRTGSKKEDDRACHTTGCSPALGPPRRTVHRICAGDHGESSRRWIPAWVVTHRRVPVREHLGCAGAAVRGPASEEPARGTKARSGASPR